MNADKETLDRWEAINRAAVEKLLGKIDWEDHGDEMGTASVRTGKLCRLPNGRAACEGPHQSGNYTPLDLKIWTRCHPTQIGIYCWHTSCARSAHYAKAARKIAAGQVPEVWVDEENENRVEQLTSPEKKAAVEQARLGLNCQQEILAAGTAGAMDRLRDSSPAKCRKWTPPMQLIGFLETVFKRALGTKNRVWIGMPNQSRRVASWGTLDPLLVNIDARYSGGENEFMGCFTSAAIFGPDCCQRANGNAVERVSFVFECDGAHLTHDDQASIILFLRDTLGMNLAAVVDSGGKSCHAHFRIPPGFLDTHKYFLTGCLKSFLPHAAKKQVEEKYWGGLGGDPAMLPASQPCRIPGVWRWDLHEGSPKPVKRPGAFQRLLYLDPSA